MVRFALFRAVEKGKLEKARALLEKGADVNALGTNGCTLLHVAAYTGHAEMVRFLLERGTDPAATDGAGYTPLDYAEGVGDGVGFGEGRCLWERPEGRAEVIELLREALHG